jgi:hypothetical protein
MTSTYEQIWVNLDHVTKTAFQTVFGTFYSNVMHQGDCNAPSTFQHLMMWLFWSHIGRGIYMYLNDIFVYSDTINEHEHLLEEVLRILTGAQLYLSERKVEFFAERIDCLGHVIDEHGIHADADKMATIHSWPTPKTVLDIQCFLGLVQYLAAYMPDLSAYTMPISSLTRKGRPFIWTPLHDRCCDQGAGMPGAHTAAYQHSSKRAHLAHHRRFSSGCRLHVWSRTRLAQHKTHRVPFMEVQPRADELLHTRAGAARYPRGTNKVGG